MKFFKRWVIRLQIVFLLLQTAFTLSSSISCSAGVATLGGQARITCFFDRDIGSSKQNFVIWRYPLDTTDLDDSRYRKDVLRCNWLEGGSKELDCLPNKGYEFHKQTVTSTASADIPIATADQEGIYKCQLVTQEIIPISTCNLTVQARDENQHIDNFISALTPTGAFVLIVVLIVECVTVSIAFIIYCCKYMRKRRREKTAKREIRTVDRGTNTNPVVPVVVECVEIAVNTDDSSCFASKGKFWSRKDDKKTTSKQSTSKQSIPKRSQEDLAETEEDKPLLPVPAPPQYGPTTDAKADDGQPHEAVGGPSEAGAEAVDTKRVEIQMASGNTDDTAQDNTETDHYTAQNENGKSKGKGKRSTIKSLLKMK